MIWNILLGVAFVLACFWYVVAPFYLAEAIFKARNPDDKT